METHKNYAKVCLNMKDDAGMRTSIPVFKWTPRRKAPAWVPGTSATFCSWAFKDARLYSLYPVFPKGPGGKGVVSREAFLEGSGDLREPVETWCPGH